MKKCDIVHYGKEERLCRTCGYVLWEDGKSNEETIKVMVEAGYEEPECKIKNKEK